MRDLEKNKQSLWKVVPLGYTDLTDSDGNYTGERVKSFSVPEEIKISLSPNDGSISKSNFGKITDFDYYATSTTLNIEDDALLFRNEPTGDYDTTYDFYLAEKLVSLNSYLYLFKERV